MKRQLDFGLENEFALRKLASHKTVWIKAIHPATCPLSTVFISIYNYQRRYVCRQLESINGCRSFCTLLSPKGQPPARSCRLNPITSQFRAGSEISHSFSDLSTYSRFRSSHMSQFTQYCIVRVYAPCFKQVRVEYKVRGWWTKTPRARSFTEVLRDQPLKLFKHIYGCGIASGFHTIHRIPIRNQCSAWASEFTLLVSISLPTRNFQIDLVHKYAASRGIHKNVLSGSLSIRLPAKWIGILGTNAQRTRPQCCKNFELHRFVERSGSSPSIAQKWILKTSQLDSYNLGLRLFS